MSPVELVQAQFDAYNAQNLDLMCSFYAEDCIVADLNGVITQNGRAAIRERYAKTWAQYPKNHARLVNRMSHGDIVVDHEQGERGPDGPSFEAICIYTVKNGLIAGVDFAK